MKRERGALAKTVRLVRRAKATTLSKYHLIFDIKQQSLGSEPMTVRIVRRGEADNVSVEFISKIRLRTRRFRQYGYVSLVLQDSQKSCHRQFFRYGLL